MTYDAWQELIECWGWHLSAQEGSEYGQRLSLPSIYGRFLNAADFKSYLQQVRESQGGLGLPQSIHKILASVACRNAYMFGERLTLEQGQDLLRNLKATQLCFSCAHGRPTMVPLVDLAVLHGSIAEGIWASGRCQSKLSLSALRRKIKGHLGQADQAVHRPSSSKELK